MKVYDRTHHRRPRGILLADAFYYISITGGYSCVSDLLALQSCASASCLRVLLNDKN